VRFEERKEEVPRNLRMSQVFTQAQRGYLSVLDERLAEIVDAGSHALPLPGTQCAAACVLGPITVVEQSGFRVGCYTSLEFREIFVKNYFESQDSGQYLCSAHWHDHKLYMSFSSGAFVIQPLPEDFITE
jgi:hypothetical protein